SGPRVSATPPVFVALFIAGLGMLILVMALPKFFYPFTWTSLVLIFEPVNYWMGRPHFLQHLRQGDWRTVVPLALGGLVCGFFWEMWNYYSFPKWIYHIRARRSCEFSRCLCWAMAVTSRSRWNCTSWGTF